MSRAAEARLDRERPLIFLSDRFLQQVRVGDEVVGLYPLAAVSMPQTARDALVRLLQPLESRLLKHAVSTAPAAQVLAWTGGPLATPSEGHPEEAGAAGPPGIFQAEGEWSKHIGQARPLVPPDLVPFPRRPDVQKFRDIRGLRPG